MSRDPSYFEDQVCHGCGGDGYEPCENYKMTYMDYILGPRPCCICFGRGKFNQSEEDERFDRMLR